MSQAIFGCLVLLTFTILTNSEAKLLQQLHDVWYHSSPSAFRPIWSPYNLKSEMFEEKKTKVRQSSIGLRRNVNPAFHPQWPTSCDCQHILTELRNLLLIFTGNFVIWQILIFYRQMYNYSWCSWGHLVVPYTEELISRPFLDENSIWRLIWDRVDPWPAAGCFFPALCHFCIGFHWIAKSHGAGTVFSGGFVSKTLRWICQGPSPIVLLWRSE